MGNGVTEPESNPDCTDQVKNLGQVGQKTSRSVDANSYPYNTIYPNLGSVWWPSGQCPRLLLQ